MARWNVLGTMAALVMLAATACQPPPPPYYQPSTILGYEVGDSVVAGDDLTVSITASDDVAIHGVSMEFTVPDSVEFRYDGFRPAEIITCDIPAVTAQPLVSVDFTCATPEWAPNGTWDATITVHDGGAAYESRASTTFELSGGSDDVSPPTVVSFEAGPNPATAGDTVSFEVRVTDEHPLHFSYRPLTWQQHGAGWMYCDETARTVFAPNEAEVVYACPVTDHPGEANATIMIRDILGNTLRIDRTIDVLAG